MDRDPSGMGDIDEGNRGLEVGPPLPEEVLEGLPDMPLRMFKLIERKAIRSSVGTLKKDFF